jgi:hypothetical protein
MRTSFFKIFVLFFTALSSCSESNNKDLKEKIVGKYYSETENNYDYFRDTIEIMMTDNGKFDVTQIANWSSAKKSDPTRPNRNKVAGEWINYGKGKTLIGDFQLSDTTIRITDPMSASVDIIKFELDKGLMYYPVRDSSVTYTKIKN